MTTSRTENPLSESKRRLLERYARERVEASRCRPSFIGPRPPGAPVPLSSEQELIWLHSKLAPELPLYNELLTVRRSGALDVDALERSLDEIVRRHEAWRTTFQDVGAHGVQVVQPPPHFSLPVCDLSALPPAEREREAARLATEEARNPLDLVHGPLVRAKLVRLQEDEHRLYILVHQIIHDGVSVYSVLLPELTALYEAFAAGRPSPLADVVVQYADYASWRRQSPAENAGAFEYWRRQLAGAPPLDLPTDHARPTTQTFRGGQHTFTLKRSLTDAVKRLSRREGATLFVTLLAAFNVLLHRHGGQEDICVGTAISTRKRPEIEKLLGVFLNTIVLRTRLAESLTFREVLARVREVTIEGLAHGDVPFHSLVRELQPRRDPGHNPIFQVTFVLEPPMPQPSLGWEMTQMDVGTGVARVDLYLQMDDRPEGLVGHVRYNADLWQPATIARLVEHFEVLLEGIAADPGMAIAAIPILTDTERLVRARDPGESRPSTAPSPPFEADEIEQSIPARFAKQVAHHGSRLAVMDGRTEWTYTELDQAADRVAHALTGAGVAAGDRVALLLDHDAPMLAGVLGVLKLGATYVPLDPTHPEERLGLIVADAGAPIVVASRGRRRAAKAFVGGDGSVVDLDDLLSAPRAPEYGQAATADQVAYLLYTSGSTGTPKGVAQSHRNVLHFIAAYANNLRLGKDDRLTMLPSYSVDAGVMDVFGALLIGATLCPIDVRAIGLDGVRQRLAYDALTVYHSTPTLYRHLARDLSPRATGSVRLVVLGGEEVRAEDVAVWRERFAPHCRLVNGFGPTESTVSLQHFVDRRTDADRRSVPIGRPVERTGVALLSREGRPGQVYGEIAIRSPHVALGYWNNAELTKRAFLSVAGEGTDRIYKTGDMGRLLPDGNMEFLGRRDLQAKIQGFRVEIGEVEAALSQHPRVKEAAAAVTESAGGDKRLVAHFVAIGTPAPRSDELRRFLRRRLPVYMIPSTFVQLDALPLTPSGKIDRLSFPRSESAGNGQEFAEPSDDVERNLVSIWKRLLEVGRVGIRDDFFELGGHSILALRLMAEIHARFGVNLPLATMFESSTVESLSDVIRSEAPGRSEQVTTVQATGGRLSFVRALVRRVGEVLRR